MASLCQDWVLEKEDPLRPTIFRNQDEYRKLIVDNPDVNYWFVSVRPRARATGCTGIAARAPYLGFTIGTDVIRGAPGRTGTLGAALHRPVRGRGERRLRDRGGGRAAGRAHGQLHGPCPRAHAQIAVRETFTNRSMQRPALAEG